MQLKDSLAAEATAASAGAGGGRVVGVHLLSPGMVATQLLLRYADNPRSARMINILAEDPAAVAAWLVPRIRRAPRASSGVCVGGVVSGCGCGCGAGTCDQMRRPVGCAAAGAPRAKGSTSNTSLCEACCGGLRRHAGARAGLCRRGAAAAAAAAAATSASQRTTRAADDSSTGVANWSIHSSVFTRLLHTHSLTQALKSHLPHTCQTTAPRCCEPTGSC